MSPASHPPWQIIPLIPIGMPEYDGGERFDLRLPYVDNGYVDDESGLSDFGRGLGKLFGFGGKKEKKEEGGKEGKGKKGKR